MSKTQLMFVLSLANILLMGFGVYQFHLKPIFSKPKPVPPPIVRPIEPEPPRPNYTLSDAHPPWLTYEKTVEKIKQWAVEAPDLTEIGTYGKSSKGKDLYYIKIGRKPFALKKPTVLITACIHGNEPLASSTTMWWVGSLLDKYGDDPEVTRLLDTRDIWLIPVVSPDTYPADTSNRGASRYVNGVDPNRNFPGEGSESKSVPPVQALREFYLKIRPQAVVSGHTWGRVFLSPFGDSMKNCPDHDKFVGLLSEMVKLSGYRKMRACDMYAGGGRLNNPPPQTQIYDQLILPPPRRPPQTSMVPIYGSEVDWYYRHGSFSSSQNGKKIHRGSFAIVMEFGTHQRIPSMQDIQTEFDRTFQAVLHFIKEAPLVEIWWDEQGNPVNADGTPKITYMKRAA